MQILVIQSPHYDFNAATLIQGLINLKLSNDEWANLQLGAVEQSNYAIGHIIDISLPEEDIVPYGRDSDIIFLCSNNGVRENLLDQIVTTEDYNKKVVYVDGEDVHQFKKNPENFLLYFKREMRLDQQHADNVRPMPFASEDRYFQQYHSIEGGQMLENFSSRRYSLTCMFGPHDNSKPWRQTIEETLKAMNYKDSFIGQLYGGGKSSSIDTGGRDHVDFYSVLCRSKLSVDAHGAFECNSARFWEIVANASCLISRKNLIHMPNPFVNGVHFFEFRDTDELIGIIDNCYSDNFKRAAEVAMAGYWHTIKYHTTEERVRYMMKEVMSAR